MFLRLLLFVRVLHEEDIFPTQHTPCLTDCLRRVRHTGSKQLLGASNNGWTPEGARRNVCMDLDHMYVSFFLSQYYIMYCSAALKFYSLLVQKT